MNDQTNFYHVYSSVLDRFLYGSTDLNKVLSLSTLLSSKIPCLIIKEDWINSEHHTDLRKNPFSCKITKDIKLKFDSSRQQIGQFLLLDTKIKIEKTNTLETYGDFDLNNLYSFVQLIHIVLTEIDEAIKYIDFFDLPAIKNSDCLNRLYKNDEFFQATYNNRMQNWDEYYEEIENITNELKKILFLSDFVTDAKEKIVKRFENKTNNIVAGIFQQFVINNLPRV